MRVRARSASAGSFSIPTTSIPERASTSAMPAPIVPSPTTPTLRNSRATASSSCVRRVSQSPGAALRLGGRRA